VNLNINSVEVHPQLSSNRHPVEWCAGGCWFTVALVHHPRPAGPGYEACACEERGEREEEADCG